MTMGDPGGIGPEIVVKALKNERSPAYAVLIAGVQEVFKMLELRTGLRIPFKTVSEKDLSRLEPGAVYFLDVAVQARVLLGAQSGLVPEPGRLSKSNAAMALAAVDVAAKLACRGKLNAIATAPLNKTAIRMILPGFHGHTEFLAQAAGVKKFAMMFVSPQLKVTLVTIHVPLQKVSGLLSRDLILEKILLTDIFLRQKLKIKRPRIAVCALNPHGRETGVEEDRVIVPAVKAAMKHGILAQGPLSADRVFFDATHGVHDAVISMYHDQALAPFKMISFYDGVNTTLGLPFVRTSPDHGTAFDIAYKNKADASSMRASLLLAGKLI